MTTNSALLTALNDMAKEKSLSIEQMMPLMLAACIDLITKVDVMAEKQAAHENLPNDLAVLRAQVDLLTPIIKQVETVCEDMGVIKEWRITTDKEKSKLSGAGVVLGALGGVLMSVLTWGVIRLLGG